MPSREATFIPRIANHSKIHQTWFSRQPNRILPNTELWMKARGKNGKHNTFENGGLVAGTWDHEAEKEREEKKRSGRRAHRWLTHSLSLSLTVLFLKNEESDGCLFLKNEEKEKKRPLGPHAFLLEIYWTGSASIRRAPTRLAYLSK
jgi:hypothetical protein